MRSLFSLWVILAVLIATPAAAQEQKQPPSIEELRVDRVDTDSYPRVSVVVTPPRELVGQGLTATNFQLVENDEIQDALVTQLANDELEVLLLLDTSGSMSEAWDLAQEAALGFVEQMPVTTRIAVLGFGSRPEVASEFTTDPTVAMQAIESLRPRGETALYDALQVAVAQFSFEPGVRRSLVLLSDGGDTVSVGTEFDTRESLSVVDIDFYAVELESSEKDKEALGRLAAAADGLVVPAADAEALADIYDRIASDLVNQYRISYVSGSYDTARLRILLDAAGTRAIADQTIKLPAAPIVPVTPEPTVPSEPAVPTPVYGAPGLRPGELVSVGFLQSDMALRIGLGAAFLAGAIAFGFLLAPRPRSSQLRRKKPAGPITEKPSVLASFASVFAGLADRFVADGGRRERIGGALERAGILLRTGEFLVLAASIVIVAFSTGLLLLNILLGAALALVTAAVIYLWVQRAATRRQAEFADQLEDTLLLMSGTLRAGYGLLQAVDTVAKEAPTPTGDEFRRLVSEVRLGRDLDEALLAVAQRTDNADFEWVVGAIAIQREVGGDLAEVLDTVASTIRDRNRIRRQVEALSAEGRISAAVLIPLPVVLAVIIGLISPGYISELFTTIPGLVGIGVGVVLMIVGSIWMRRVVKLEF